MADFRQSHSASRAQSRSTPLFGCSVGARALLAPPSRGSEWMRPGGRPCCWNKAGGAARASRCGWRRAGAGREQGAAAREARGRPAVAGAPAAACVGQEQPGTAGAAVAMAVAVGRPSVSARASLLIPGRGMGSASGRVRVETCGDQKGMWVVAAGDVGVCMVLGARLGRRAAWGAHRLRAYLMQQWIALARPYFGAARGKGPPPARHLLKGLLQPLLSPATSCSALTPLGW